MKIIKTNDFFGTPADFAIVWSTVCLTCTFAIGIQLDCPDEFTIFHVTSFHGKDEYTVLDTCFYSIFERYNYSIEEKVKKEMEKVITRVLTTRIAANMLTVEQVINWSENN